MSILENLIDKAFTSGGFTGLMLLLMMGLVFYVVFVLNRINIAFILAIKSDLYKEDHDFKTVKKVAYNNRLLRDRRTKPREVSDGD